MIKYSVVITTYNRMHFLKNAIDSVLNQTFRAFELFIVDDGSTDATHQLIDSYSDARLKYVRLPHKGVSFARNTGIRLSRGEFIAFLDSDDKWERNKLETADRYVEEFPLVKLFHTEEIWYRKGKLLKQKKKHKKYSGFIYRKCLPLCCIGMSTVVVKREAFNEAGFFDTNLHACEDYDMWLRFCISNEVMLIPQPLTVKYGGRADQLSSRPGLDKYRIHALEKMLKCISRDDPLREATYREFVNKCNIYARGCEKRGKQEEASYYLDKIIKFK